MQILFVFAAVIFLLTLLATITSVKETPLILNEEKIALLQRNEITNLPEDLIYEQNYVESKNRDSLGDDDNDDEEDKPVTLRMLYQSVLKVV